MGIKSTYFTSKQGVNFESHINTRESVLRVYFNVIINFIKTTLLISITFLNTPFLHAAKDNLYNVTTFAGSGTAGYADGTGTTASFNGPNGITSDSAGNIYVTDRQNYVIRKITPAGVVTTFAGIASKPGNTDGPRTSAQFSSLIIGIKCDGSENLYLSDYGNSTIRKISISSGAVTTFARSTPSIHNLTVNQSGDVYYTNASFKQVTKIPSGRSAQVFAGSTVAGSTNGAGTSARFNYPTGITINSAKNLYVADQGDNLIRQITETGIVTTFAGGTNGHENGTGTAAKFSGPTDVQQDKSGNLYVTDGNNNLIRKITPTGIVTTIAGGGGGITPGAKNGLGTNATFNFPYSLTVDNNGNIYIAEYTNNMIRKLTPNYIGPGTTDTVLTSTDYGTYESINLAGGTIKVGTNALTITNSVLLASNTTSVVDATSVYIVLAGKVSGAGALTISGGTFVFTDTNPYTGTITINPNSQLQFGLGGPQASVASSSIINNGLIQFGTSGVTSCSSNISGTGGLWKSISGTLTLSNNNSYTGSTNIDASPNNQKNAILIGDISKSVGVSIASTCAYDLNGTNRTLIDPSGAGTIQSSTKSADLTLISKNSLTFGGTINNTISSVTIDGSGKLALVLSHS